MPESDKKTPYVVYNQKDNKDNNVDKTTNLNEIDGQRSLGGSPIGRLIGTAVTPSNGNFNADPVYDSRIEQGLNLFGKSPEKKPSSTRAEIFPSVKITQILSLPKAGIAYMKFEGSKESKFLFTKKIGDTLDFRKMIVKKGIGYTLTKEQMNSLTQVLQEVVEEVVDKVDDFVREEIRHEKSESDQCKSDSISALSDEYYNSLSSEESFLPSKENFTYKDFFTIAILAEKLGGFSSKISPDKNREAGAILDKIFKDDSFKNLTPCLKDLDQKEWKRVAIAVSKEFRGCTKLKGIHTVNGSRFNDSATSGDGLSIKESGSLVHKLILKKSLESNCLGDNGVDLNSLNESYQSHYNEIAQIYQKALEEYKKDCATPSAAPIISETNTKPLKLTQVAKGVKSL